MFRTRKNVQKSWENAVDTLLLPKIELEICSKTWKSGVKHDQMWHLVVAKEVVTLECWRFFIDFGHFPIGFSISSHLNQIWISGCHFWSHSWYIFGKILPFSVVFHDKIPPNIQTWKASAFDNKIELEITSKSLKFGVKHDQKWHLVAEEVVTRSWSHCWSTPAKFHHAQTKRAMDARRAVSQ